MGFFMRRILLGAGLLISAGLLHAQRGGGHAGGGVGHASFGGGLSRSAVSAQGFSHAAPTFTAPAHSSLQQTSRFQQGSAYRSGNWGSTGYQPSHAGQGLSRYGRRGGRVGYGRYGYGYGYGYPLIGYPAFGYDDGFDDSSSDQNFQGNALASDSSPAYGYQDGPQQGPEEAYGGQADPGYGFPPPNSARAPYSPGGSASPDEGQAINQGSASDGLQHPKVTLVFKDGHTLQVQNYALTQTKVLVTDNSAVRDIPISALDANATAAANDAAGVDFSLPGAKQH